MRFIRRTDRVCGALLALWLVSGVAFAQGPVTYPSIRITSTAADALCVGGSGSVPSSCTGGIKSGPIVATTLDLNSAGLAWGDVSKSGSSLADLATRSASDLSSGTLADGRLSSNVALLASANTFTATQTISLTTGRALNVNTTAASGTWLAFQNSGVDKFYIGNGAVLGMGTVNDIAVYGLADVYLSAHSAGTARQFSIRNAGWYFGSNIMDSVGTPTCSSGCTMEGGINSHFWISGLTTGVVGVIAFGGTGFTNPPICTVTPRVASGTSLDRYSVSAVSGSSISVGTGDATPDPVNVICRGY